MVLEDIMKKKIIVVIFAAVFCCSLAAGLTACKKISHEHTYETEVVAQPVRSGAILYIPARVAVTAIRIRTYLHSVTAMVNPPGLGPKIIQTQRQRSPVQTTVNTLIP